MQNMTKGKLEAEVSDAITRFEKEHLGRGPRETRAHIVEDMILIRLKGVLTPAEESLARTPDGSALIKQIRMQLVENSRDLIEALIEDITQTAVKALYTDISSETGERVFVIILDRNLEMDLN